MEQQLQQIIERCKQVNSLSAIEIKGMILILSHSFLSQNTKKSIQQSDKQNRNQLSYVDEEIDRITDVVQRKMNMLDAKMEKINESLKDQLIQKTGNILNQVDNRIKLADQKINEQLNVQRNMLQNWNQKIQQWNEKIQNQIKVLHEKLRNHNLSTNNMLNDIEVLRQRVMKYSLIVQKIQKQKQELNRQRQRNYEIKPTNAIKQSPIKALNWIDPECKDIKNIILKENSISNKDKYCTQAFGKIRIKGQTSFSVHIRKMNLHIGLGIVDCQYRKGFAWGTHPNIVMYLNDGLCLVGKQERQMQGSLFRNGEKVKVEINLPKGVVEWTVDRQIRHRVEWDLLKDDKISWVPCIAMFSLGDSVDLLD